MINEYKISSIGNIISPFKEKFGIPRQPGIISTIESKILLNEDYSSEECFRGLESFSHIWILFLFNENIDKGWKKIVRPPRLGGNKKVGVFSSRSPFRPNFIGMSAVELVSIEVGKNTCLNIKGADLLDGTPIIDIKPYIKYADSIIESECGDFTKKPVKDFKVVFSSQAESVCDENKGLKSDLENILSYDTRPAYYGKSSENKIFGMKFESFDVRFEIQSKCLHIIEIV